MATTNNNIPQFNNRQKFRVGGSGFTAFYWNNSVIAFAQRISVRQPEAITNPSVIQPLDARYPLQIITPGAIGAGYLEVEMLELYNQKVWDRMVEVATGSAVRANDLADVFFALASVSQPISAVKMIVPPQNLQGDTSLKAYGEIYHNCVITNINDGEAIDVRSMEIVKGITIAYTHMTRTDSNTQPDGINPGQPTYGHILDNYNSLGFL
jgi:hypothetical protein